jgi:predicted small lipoprotein YifL
MEMKRPRAIVGAVCLVAAAFAGCGQKGPLYLPDEARDVVTRPAPPADPAAPNSSETVDSPDTPPSPAPEVTAPAPTEKDADKDKNGKPPR